MNNDKRFRNFDDLLNEFRKQVAKSPSHYPGDEPFTLIRELGTFAEFAQGNILKYVTRCRRSGTPRKDLFKALHYTLMLLRELESNGEDP